MGGSTDGQAWHAAPEARHRPATYWFWNRIPTSEQAAAQLREIVEAGFSTVLIQPRPSFPRDQYMSDAYLSAYRQAVQIAGGLGLEVGIYDEYSWISGHGGGRTVDGAEQLRERHLFWSSSTPTAPLVAKISSIRSEWIDGLGPVGARWLYDGGTRSWGDWELVAAVARASESSSDEAGVGDWIDVSHWAMVLGDSSGCVTLIADGAPIPAGWLVTVFVSARCTTSRLINYLDPHAARRFIDVVYEPYAQACAGLLGDPITHFQFDHPYGGFYDWEARDGEVGNSLMWTVRSDWLTRSLGGDGMGSALGGDQLVRLLLAVIYDRSDRGRIARAQFFAAYSEQGIESFFGQLGRWASEHGVGLTGHEYLAHVGGWGLDDGFPEVDGRTNFGLDYFKIDQHRTETLVDACNFSPQISPHFGDSIARAHGRSRCIVEQYASRDALPGHYAAGYWELELGELRVAALRHHLLGARQFLFHAFAQSDGSEDNVEVLANPRFDFPPAINFEPWFKHFPAVAEELANVSAFIDGATPARAVALVYPLSTVWAEGPNHVHSRLVGEWSRLLSCSGVGFDLVDDRDLAAAEVVDGALRIGAHCYRSVILAGVTVLPAPSAVAALEALVECGGSIFATGPLPTLSVTHGPDRDLARRVDALCPTGAEQQVPDVVPPGLRINAQRMEVAVSPGGGTIWQWVGSDGDSQRVLLLNDSNRPRAVKLSGDGDCEVVKLTAGGRESLAATLLEEERTELRLVLAAEELVCLTFTARERIDLPLSGDWTLSVEDRPAVAIAVERGWECQGYEEFCGEGVYHCAFDLPTALIDGALGCTLSLPVVHCVAAAVCNGVEVGVCSHQPYTFELDVTRLRERGNRLELRVTNSAANRYYAQTAFAAAPAPSGLGAAPVLSFSSQRRTPIVERQSSLPPESVPCLNGTLTV